MLASAQVVTTDLGKVKGHRVNGVTSFKGIPFAARRLGTLGGGHHSPQQVGTASAMPAKYGHDCIQKPFPSDAAPLGTTPAEDCLVGNLWVPKRHEGKLPILIWI